MRQFCILLLFAIAGTSCFAQLVPYRVSLKWGYSDTAGNIVITPKYDQTDFFDGTAAFVKIDSLFYLINTKAEMLTEGFIHHGKFVNGLCPVINKAKKGFYINHSGKNAFNIVFSGVENFSEGLAVVAMKNKLGIINEKGGWVREPDFDSSSVYFKSGFLLAKNKGKFFYIDKYGRNLVLPDSLKPAGVFSEGWAAVYLVRKIIENGTGSTRYNLRFIDSAGKIVLSKFEYEGVDFADYLNIEKEFTDGKAIVNVPTQLAYQRYFIDMDGKFSEEYSFAQHLGDSLFLGVVGYYLPSVRIYDKHFYVMGDFVKTIKSVGVFGNGLIQVQDHEGMWGYCDSNTKVKIPFIYQMANSFENGYAIVVKLGRYGVINTQGKEFFTEY